MPRQSRYTYYVTLLPSNPTYTLSSVPVYYVESNKTMYASEF